MNLENSAIHLWQADKADFSIEQLVHDCLPWLSEAEQHRYERYQLAGSKQEYLAGQMLIRTVLSEYAEFAPADWKIDLLANGKPFIAAPELASPIHFNLSHSADRLVLAVSRHELTGVDIEYVKPGRRIEQIAARHFSTAELAQLSGLEDVKQTRRFYELWTLKEAFIKAIGTGLQHSLQNFGFEPGESKLEFWIDQAADREDRCWQFWQLQAGNEFCLGLACSPDAPQQVSKVNSFQRLSLHSYQAIDTSVVRRSV